MVTAKLFLGTDRSNRTIAVTATADSATTTSNVDVTGTTINISGVSALASGASTTYTFSLKDSAQKPISGIALLITSKNGNTIALTPATGITDSTGQVSALITGTTGGTDTISATGAGASKSQTLAVDSDAFAFTIPAAPVAPATTIDIPLNTATPVSVTWKSNGVPVAGSKVDFAATRGTITASSVTDAAGTTPGITVTSATSGPSTISATGPSGRPAATVTVVFVTKSASNVTAQAVPGTVQHTTGVASQTSNASTVSAVVRDTSNNLVKDALVNFNITSDPSGGGLSAASAITDVSGTASVVYTAGNTSSAQNGVLISATATAIAGVAIAPVVVGTTALTVSGQAVLVRLGSDNLATSNSPTSPTYSKTYAAIVTDTAGNPVPGTDVHFALRPGRYQKGSWNLKVVVIDGAQSLIWGQDPTIACPNEDRNFNGFLDTPPAVTFPIDVENQPDPGAGGIPNGFGSLQPGMPASVNATGTTDTKGVAVATITYPKNHAFWTEVILEARTGVSSNDPPAYTAFLLHGLADDFANNKIDPPGRLSPWGVGATCGDLL